MPHYPSTVGLPAAVRLHDQFYLTEERRKIKESFKFIGGKTFPFLQTLEVPSVLDIGCATGDFLWYLKESVPSAELHGFDILPELLKEAEKNVPGAAYSVGDICRREDLPQRTFDAVYMLGVHSAFDSCEEWVRNVLTLTALRGRAYVFGLFNPEEVDMQMRARYADGRTPWQVGWNMLSQRTVLSCLEREGAKGTFDRFVIGTDLPRRPDDPLRSWTFPLANGEQATINGTQVLHHYFLLTIIREGGNA